MRRAAVPPVGTLAAILVLLVAAKPLPAQEAPRCDPRFTAGLGRRIEDASGRVSIIGSAGVRSSCIGSPGTPDAGSVLWRAYSDSVARYVYLGRIDFVGSVWFSDSTAELTADRAAYYEPEDRLDAFDNVRLVNQETGSVLTGPHLVYHRAVADIRDEAELFATRRPRVEYRTEGDTASPYVIVADRVRLMGSISAWAGGNVTIERDDFSATADSATLDVDAETGLLVGHAQAASRDSAGYSLNGRRIAYRLVDNELTWVQAQGMAEGTSAEWRIVGDTIEFAVADDQIQAGMVWGDSTRPSAMSESHTITAESLAVDTPGQVLTEVRAFRGAVATSRPDSTSIEVDWMAGDTVLARFDSTESGARTLAELHALGNARAFYHVFDEEDPEAPAALNYVRGLRILAVFSEETVQRVDVVGQADGVYLEPVRRPGS